LTSGKKIYFVSDAHLGASALSDNEKRERLLVKWLDQIKDDAGMIFLLGDIFDFWFEYKSVVPRGFVRFLGKVAEITDSGIPVHFFTGNHDVWVFDYLPKETGMIIHHEPYVTEIMGKRFFIAHGDGLTNLDRGYNLLKWLFHNRFAQWLFARLHPNFAFGIAHRWSRSSRLSNGIDGEGYLGDSKEEQIVFAKEKLKEEHFDFFVFGHRHLPIELNISEKSKVFVLGEWIKSYTYGVFDGEKFKLRRFTN
jgi:UDP-2,3-diacylglucosamine hydrolase